MEEPTKICKQCQTKLPISKFTPTKSRCKECRATEAKIKRTDSRPHPHVGVPEFDSASLTSFGTQITEFTTRLNHFQTVTLNSQQETQERLDDLAEEFSEMRAEIKEEREARKALERKIEAAEKEIAELKARNKRFDEYIEECFRRHKNGEIKFDYAATLFERDTPLIRLDAAGRSCLILPYKPE